jgi:mono/diheme cytochrome c family protein
MTKRTRWTRWTGWTGWIARIGFASLLAWVSLLGGPGGSGEAIAQAQRAIDEEHPGYPYYRQYCASCHGIFADGKGLVAPILKRQPADLSRLTRAYGHPLPEARLAEFITGTAMPSAHGRSDMPVWGKKLKEQIAPGLANQPARRMIVDQIVDYLVAIQVDPTP